MQKYWAENKQVQAWGFRIIKTIILGSFGLLICAFAIETVADFIKLVRNSSVVVPQCTPDCNFFVTVSLFCLLCLYQIGLLIGLIKCPKGFWLNFLLVFWGISGLMYLEDGWAYSWQPQSYSWTLLDGRSYMQYINRSLIGWMVAVIGVSQIYLPKRVRKHVIWCHSGVVGLIGLIGGG